MKFHGCYIQSIKDRQYNKWSYCPYCGANLEAIHQLFFNIPDEEADIVHGLLYDYWIDETIGDYGFDKWFDFSKIDLDEIAKTWCDFTDEED